MPNLSLHPQQAPRGLSEQEYIEWYQDASQQLGEDCRSRTEKHRYLAGANKRVNSIFSIIIWTISAAISAPLVAYVYQRGEAKSQAWGIVTLIFAVLVPFLSGLHTRAEYLKTRFEHEQAEQSFHAYVQNVTERTFAVNASVRDAHRVYISLLTQKSDIHIRAPDVLEDGTFVCVGYWHVLTAFVFH